MARKQSESKADALPKRDAARVAAQRESDAKLVEQQAAEKKTTTTLKDSIMPTRKEGQRLYRVGEFVLLTEDEANDFNNKGHGRGRGSVNATTFLLPVPPEAEEQINNAILQTESKG